MQVSIAWSTHLPVLIKLIGITNGPVLELGAGLFSTPYLHWVCFQKRELVTYENQEQYIKYLRGYERYNSLHEIIYLTDWDKVDIERPWDIVLVDHSPALRRKEEARRVANYAKYVVLHDTQPETEHEYKYSEIYPLYKYRYDYKKNPTNTTVLSNFVDLKDFEA